MMLKVGIRLNADLYHTGHGSKLLHLSRLKAVRFSYPFISKGLSCFSILMESFVPNSFTRALVMTLILLVSKTEDGTTKSLTQDPLLFAVLISIQCDFYPILV